MNTASLTLEEVVLLAVTQEKAHLVVLFAREEYGREAKDILHQLLDEVGAKPDQSETKDRLLVLQNGSRIRLLNANRNFSHDASWYGRGVHLTGISIFDYGSADSFLSWEAVGDLRDRIRPRPA